MKNTILLAIGALLATASIHAQSTVDSIAAKYQLQPMPEAWTVEKKFPALGSYQLNNADGTTANLTVTLDSANKGVVWVEGLPQGKFKAYLKKSPSTYRIIPQTTDNGKQIPEGTLYYNAEANVLNVALGKAYDETDPTGIFSMDNTAATNDNTVEVKTKTSTAKTKTKISFYTANKLDQGTTSVTPNKMQ